MNIFQSLIESDFGSSHRNFEAVIREGDKLIHWFRGKSGDEWKPAKTIVESGVAGPGSIIQSGYKAVNISSPNPGSLGQGNIHTVRRGNFDVVVPLFNADGRMDLCHFYHHSPGMSAPWQRGQMIASNVAGGGSLIQSSFGTSGHANFEVVVPLFTTDGQIELWHFWCDNSGQNPVWRRGLRITGDGDIVGGPGAIIQSDYGAPNGNFEVVVPLKVQGGVMELRHFHHDNSDTASPWQRGEIISANISGPGSIIQSSFGTGGHGNFEVVVPEGNSLVHYWRDNSTSDLLWNRGQTIGETITDSATGWGCFIQSTGENRPGNFEVLVEECKQSVVHYYRYNQDFLSRPWLRRHVLIREPEPRRLTGTRKVVQLTGEYDRQGWNGLGVPPFAHNRTESRFEIRGTDLGVSFPHKDKVYFLFGDTFRVTQNSSLDAPDFIAYSEDTNVADGINLTFYDDPPVIQPSIEQGGFSVPIDGVSVNDRMYVFFSDGSYEIDGHVLMKQTVLTRSDDDGRIFKLLHVLSRDKFINVSVERRKLDRITAGNLRLPPNTEVLWVWGSGRYRSSDVYLAVMPLGNIETGAGIKYFAGRRGLTALWSSQESDAEALFCAGCVGELSVRWNPFLKRYLALFNSDNPRGIVLHSAMTPYGPWSKEPVMVFDPGFLERPDDPCSGAGYGRFMHKPWSDDPNDIKCDYVHDDMFGTWREKEWGGEYGPYQITNYATGVEGQYTQIYFTMSTWNPYQVMLMTTRITTDDL